MSCGAVDERSASGLDLLLFVCQSAHALQLIFVLFLSSKRVHRVHRERGLNVRDPGAPDTRSERIKREESWRGDGSGPVVGA